MMHLRSQNPSEKQFLDGKDDSKLHRRRWRTAFTAIYFTKLLVTLSKKVVDQTKLLRSLSYVSINVPDDTPRLSLMGIDQKILSDVVKEKNLESLDQLGGVVQVAAILESDMKDGISGTDADLAHRRAVFGANTHKKPPMRSFLSFFFDALKDTTIIILLVCAFLSLAFGIMQHGPKEGWYDGASIIIAVILVVALSAMSNFKQSRQFTKLSDESKDIKVQVVRDARHYPVSIFDIVVGDVVFLKIGDQVPADGLFLEGYSLKLDESSMTGESDHVEVNGSRNPFLMSGTKVADGFGSMLVTSVGMNTSWGEMLSCIIYDVKEQTPLQARLDKLASWIGKVGLTVAILVLTVMMARYFTGSTRDESGHREYDGTKTKVSDVLNAVVKIVSAAVTILVVAIPEGLPLAVTLTLAYSMKKMMGDKAMVRKLSACETMGSATTITQFGAIIENMAAKSLRCIAFAHRKIEEHNAQISEKLEETGLTLLGLIGLKDPCRPGVRAAVETEQRTERIDDIRVMARSSPFDKLLMVKCLKERGHVVAVTGDGTNDAPALKEADIGLSMGIQGTEVAKESSDIVILDDNFTSVVTVLRWGRCVYNNIQKFLQFQLTVNVAALVINFVAAVSSGKVPLTAVQLLWVNLIMDTLGALALATEQPTNDLMTKPPVGRSGPLITRVMWRNLIAQALYQVVILLTLQFRGKSTFGVDEKVKNTLIFNSFVLIVLQVLMVELLKKFANTERLNWGQWGACIGIGMVSWLISFLVKCIPVSSKQLPQRRSFRSSQALLMEIPLTWKTIFFPPCIGHKKLLLMTRK